MQETLEQAKNLLDQYGARKSLEQFNRRLARAKDPTLKVTHEEDIYAVTLRDGDSLLYREIGTVLDEGQEHLTPADLERSSSVSGAGNSQITSQGDSYGR